MIIVQVTDKRYVLYDLGYVMFFQIIYSYKSFLKTQFVCPKKRT